MFSQSCGDYALMFLVLKARGASMHDFLSLFSSKDFVSNDREVGNWSRGRLVDELGWQQLKPADQTTTKCGLRDLLL